MKKLSNHKAALFISAVSLIVFACGSTKNLIPTQADVPIAQAHWAGTTMDELTKGYNIYAEKCTECHGMKKPQNFTEDEWTINYMPSMGKKAKLQPDEYQLVLHYILTKREEIRNIKK